MTASPSPSGSGGSIPAVAVAAVTLVTLGVLAAVVILTLNGKPIDSVVLVLGAVVAPTVTSLLAFPKLTHVQNGLADVQGKVDGKIDNLITDKSNLETQIAQQGIMPITSKVSYDPVTTGPINMDLVPPTMPQRVVQPQPAPRRHRATD